MAGDNALPPTLRTPRAVLRPFEPGDVAGRRRCGRDPHIIRMFGGSPGFDAPVTMSETQAQRWYDRAVAEQPRSTHWAVEFEGRFVGTARLHSFATADRRSRYAVGLLDHGVLGRGLGTEITRAVLQHGFDELALHRIDLRVLAVNTRAIACYARCGFVEEGRERQAALVGGEWQDDLVMGVLESDLRPTG